jgi:hypothetical protein
MQLDIISNLQRDNSLVPLDMIKFVGKYAVCVMIIMQHATCNTHTPSTATAQGSWLFRDFYGVHRTVREFYQL